MILSYKNFSTNLNRIVSLENKPKLAVGVSGGPDSIALTLLLKKWIEKKQGKLLGIVIDHNLRPESSFEAIKIKKFLNKNDIDSKILKIKKKYSTNNLQQFARDNRYNLLTNYCKKNNIFHLFIGHHYDDNFETFVFRKIVGSGIEGLYSIKNINYINSIEIIRPLLLFKKKEIIKYLKKNKIEWIDDPFNKNEKFSRIAIRNFFKDKNSDKKNLIDEFNYIRKIYPKYMSMIYNHLNLSILKINLNSVELNFQLIENLPSEISIKIIEILARYLHVGKKISKLGKLEKIYYRLIKSKNILLRSQNTAFFRNANLLKISNFN